MAKSIRRLSFLLLFAALAAAGCATRQYVKRQVGTVEPQIAEIRTAQGEHAERIDAVDRRSQAGLRAANRAGSAAERATEMAHMADRTATSADLKAEEADRHADTALQSAQQAFNRIDAVDNRISMLDRYTVADAKTITFKCDSDELLKEGKSKLDEIAGLVSGMPSGYVVELQGFTDDIGTDKYNFGLSGRRADAVLRYLVSKDIPLYRITIAGLGKAGPVADNKTTAGRELNRRVEVRILRSTADTTAVGR